MITIVQAKNTNEVIELIKPQVALVWVNDMARASDTFNRTFIQSYQEFAIAAESIPRDSDQRGDIRRHVSGCGYVTDAKGRVYIAAVLGRSNPTMTIINPKQVEANLEQIAKAMRADGLKSIVLPLISTNRTIGFRTVSYLEMLDRIFHDFNVSIATAVPLHNHGFAYHDITNTYIPRPKIEVKRRVAVPTHGWGDNPNPYGYQPPSKGFADQLDPQLFKTPIKEGFMREVDLQH